jgi:hypothetical protein
MAAARAGPFIKKQEISTFNFSPRQEAAVTAIFLKRGKFTTYLTDSRRYRHGSK